MPEKQISEIIYELALKTQKTDDNAHILDQLDHEIDRCLLTDDTPIYEAINIAESNNRIDASGVIRDELFFCIEEQSYLEDNVEYESTFCLLPMVISSTKLEINLPNLEHMQSTIRKLVAEKNIIPDPSRILVGTYRLSQQFADDMALKDWYEMHKDIISCDYNNESIKKIRNSDALVDLEALTETIHIPIILKYPSEYRDTIDELKNFLNPDSTIWEELGKEFSGENFAVSVLPPNSIPISLDFGDEAKQQTEFNSFWLEHLHSNPQGDILYANIADEPNLIGIFVIDTEDNSLDGFFIYDSIDKAHVITDLIDKMDSTSNKTLWGCEQEITKEDLEQWAESEDSVDMNKLISESNLINVEESAKFIFGYSDSSKKRTLH